MTAAPLDLDDLWADTRRIAASKPPKTPAKRITNEAPPEPARLFNDPANWVATRGIALIHAETQTLLGNFTEYVHRSVHNARKLVREDKPLTIVATERVSGEWWICPERKIAPPAPSYERIPYIVQRLVLEGIGWSPLAEVEVCLEYGAIARIELALPETQFAGTAFEGLVTLPRGVDVCGLIDRETKIALRKDLAI